MSNLYKRTHHSTTEVITPYQLMFGRDIRTELQLLNEGKFHTTKNQKIRNGAWKLDNQ